MRSYSDALARVPVDPADAAQRCTAVSDSALRDDCVTAAAEALATTSAAASAALCSELPAGSGRDECYFQVAEKAGDARLCAQAGSFADDCRLHRLSADLRELISRGAAPGDFEVGLAAALVTYGLAEDDPRPWSAAYRWVLGAQRPLDRSSCSAAPDELRVEACQHTALALFQDRLNNARDRGTFPCDGGALPASLTYQPDAELDGILAARRAGDLCP